MMVMNGSERTRKWELAAYLLLPATRRRSMDWLREVGGCAVFLARKK
jgi:hypothetical protein